MLPAWHNAMKKSVCCAGSILSKNGLYNYPPGHPENAELIVAVMGDYARSTSIRG